MLKRLFHTFLLMLTAAAAYADGTLSGYEYWVDADYGKRTVSNSSQADISFSVDLNDQQQGIHFLNFRAYDSEGQWGSVKRLLYYIPEVSSPDIALKGYEYWMDNDVSSRSRVESSNGQLSFAIDISQLAPGIHFFNFRAYNTDGDMGALKRYLCYIPETASADATVTQYEYWTDDDQATKLTQLTTGGDIALAIDISAMTAGIHFLNFRAQNSDGIWGALKRLLFYLPESSSALATVTQYEYWMDGDAATKVTQQTTEGNISLAIDISAMAAGIHFLNFRAQNSDGIWGSLKRMMFYTPEPTSEGATVTQYEYWMDGDATTKVTQQTTAGNISLAIDISDMAAGIHFLNFRAQNSDGIWGSLKRQLFYLPEDADTNATLAGYEYWIDDHAEDAVRSTSPQTNQIFSLDLSGVEPGVHYLSYRAKNSKGVWSALKRFVFYLSDGSENTGSPLVAYLYRFNTTTTEVPITPTQAYTMQEQVFEIPDAEEFLKIDPSNPDCRFTFNSGNETTASMTQTSDVSFSIQFKNDREVLSAPVNADFQLSDSVQHEVETLAIQGALTFPKVGSGDFYAFSIQVNDPNQPLYIKATQACTIAFFDTTGNLVHTPLDSAAVKQTASLAQMNLHGTYYGIVYDMVKNEGNPADNITLRLMTTNNIVPTPEIVYQQGNISISCLQQEARIHYTTDGTTPTEAADLYTTAFPVSHNMTVKAMATFDDMQPSDVATLIVDTFTVAAPVILFTNLQLYITCATPGAAIYYTTDGSDPLSEAGLLYSAPVPVTQSCTVKAVARREHFNDSPLTTYELDVNNVKVDKPTITVNGNTLIVTTLTSNVQIRYTTDGTEPTTESTPYEGGITLQHNCTVKVKGFKAGYLASETAVLIADWFYAEKPVMTISDDETLLTISCATPGAVIYYEIGGAVPTTASAVYTAPLVLTDNRVVKAFAVAPDYNDSEVSVYQPGSHACQPAVIASNGITVTVSTATADARIYYTVNGATPTEKSEYVVGEGTIALSSTIWTIKTLVAKENMNNSAVTTYQVPAFYDRTGHVLYTQEKGHAAEGFAWNGGINTDSEMTAQGLFDAGDIRFFRTLMPRMQHLDLTGARIDGNQLADSAFARMDSLVTITLPAQLLQVGNGLLADCPHLAAVQWTSDINVPAPDALVGDYSAHGNMLLYVKANSLAPAAYRNVVTNGIADNIRLTDDGGDFYCPSTFTARRISYTHDYTQQTVPDVCRGWESIALPFDVQTYTHAVNGSCTPFAARKEGCKLFWLYELSATGFQQAEGIMANTPYIISMPNNDNYADDYILGGTMTFGAENTSVAASGTTETRSNSGFVMYVNYGLPRVSRAHTYAMNIGQEYQGHPEGSMFVRDLRNIRPFETYLSTEVMANSQEELLAQAPYYLLFDDNQSLGIGSLPMLAQTLRIYTRDGSLYVDAGTACSVRIYNTGGQLVRMVNVPAGTTRVEGLQGGVYVVSGKKLVVRK